MGADDYGYYLSEIDPEKANFYGDTYISDTIIHLANEKSKEMSYKYYVTDALHAIVSNTAGAQRVTLNATFREMWEGSAKEEEQPMSPEEIIEKMKEEFRKKGGAK